MKLLFIDHEFSVSSVGGAFKSNYAIIRELEKNPTIEILVLADKTKNIFDRNLKAKQFNLFYLTSSKKINKFIQLLKLYNYLSFFTIYNEIKKFKPDFIIVQRDHSFPAILAGFFRKVPVINIIRDAMEFCPKYIDIVKSYQNCNEPISRELCWKCINKWRTLRILLLDKEKGSEKSYNTLFSTIYYKLQYFKTQLYLFLLKYVYANIVASPQMKMLIHGRSNKIRVLLGNITPIDDSDLNTATNMLNANHINKIQRFNKKILYIIPRNEGGSKGYPFVYAMLKKIPEDILVIIVGTKLNNIQINSNVINIERISTSNLYYLYKNADITIVPSIYTEAFGRVIIESIINKTPVIISPQCGARFLFEKKEYVKILPLKVELWLKEINELLRNPVIIPEEDIKCLEKRFSARNCAKTILSLIKKY